MNVLQRNFKQILKHQSVVKRTFSINVVLKQKERNNATDEEAIYKENWKIRCELATAYRAFERLGMNEGLCNHLTAKAPTLHSESAMILIIPYGLYWSDVTPSDLVGIDINTAKLIEGRDIPEITANSIHRGIYKHRKDIQAIMHTHPKYTTALSVLGDPEIKMFHQNSMRFVNKVAYDKGYDGVASDKENDESDRLGQAIGDKQILLMSNHGLTTTGRSVAEAFDRNYYFEKAAEVQILAYQTGKPLSYLPDHVVKTSAEYLKKIEYVYANAHLYGFMNKLRSEDTNFIKNFDSSYCFEDDCKNFE